MVHGVWALLCTTFTVELRQMKGPGRCSCLSKLHTPLAPASSRLGDAFVGGCRLSWGPTNSPPFLPCQCPGRPLSFSAVCLSQLEPGRSFPTELPRFSPLLTLHRTHKFLLSSSSLFFTWLPSTPPISHFQPADMLIRYQQRMPPPW